ncbi:MAG TPA: ribosome maturation factor RimP [Micrococcaceae bacterium]|jgi:ribosome maturation factor RimP|nr:ribosome maturation factor RimP [Micrococcaceae bacterium]
MSKPDRPNMDRHGANSANSVTTAEAHRLFDLLNPTVQAHGLFLEDVNVHLAGTHRTISVVVDLQQDQSGSVGMDKISEISRELSAVMDSDPHEDDRPYDLEISSPGVGRPLTEPRHWRRARGRMVKVNLGAGEDITGRLLDVDGDGITIRPELPVKKGMKPKQGEPERIGFGKIRKGNVEIEFSRLDDAQLDEEFDPTDAVEGEEG